MLRELSVQNLALIEDVRVELTGGFCAWTGETGAGKSLLLGALGLLLGERGSSELLRAGADELKVIGRFECQRPELREAVEAILQETLEDETLILTRRLHRSGKSSAWVNGNPVVLNTLRKLGEVLVDIHGQRESHSLLQPAYQLRLLDSFGKLVSLCEDYQQAAEGFRQLRQRVVTLTEQRHQRQRELSLIRHEREELDQAELRPHELTELAAERERLAHAQSLQRFTAMVASELYDADGAVIDRIGRLEREAESWSEVDPQLQAVAERLSTLSSEIQDVAETCRDLCEGYEGDPDRLAQIEKRLQWIRRLESKYRRSADDLIAYRDTLDSQELALQGEEDEIDHLEAELAERYAKLREIAGKLSKRRAAVAEQLASQTQLHLADLGMPNARLTAQLEPLPWGTDPKLAEIPIMGMDRLEFVLAANPGEPPRPLRKVASGGELSRTLLALKTVLAEHDPVGMLIFDEIDANVGGRLGDVLGKKLAMLGQTHQVLCVTHLPQVASYAESHWTIRKQVMGDRTSTRITCLRQETDRVEELASMLRGESRGDLTRQEAAQMLTSARALALLTT
ncbi:DNA repair protein RecN [Tuwongella immobilis]|uniref:DNA repair protein RecN n=1 Tax=Tuwongella immobilis TaxID=692036 RepID=A0A6C2YQV5_9BACT|nr:DNA repair protein RecN [Tuwongella immobilis]VIP03866.1 dna repair protein : DNA repair protein RecN OS=Isosphaera pallida (strain ATCC 43644 / DSM 9630 / IS1B) GN=Isop_2126 PE=3 SV=1: SMC_N [Tuwongella immobilis]VTS05099.1 dna repair protein : DNA repair protein RecN OS=Isosphaera pallida (strain ATCC 43644 / DSM 9630 / IS1B) GN=Isop_2126 PE=3 SV=1: SMC_N [Tuwongella immobilis]